MMEQDCLENPVVKKSIENDDGYDDRGNKHSQLPCFFPRLIAGVNPEHLGNQVKEKSYSWILRSSKRKTNDCERRESELCDEIKNFL